jgi:hypothetical protein
MLTTPLLNKVLQGMSSHSQFSQVADLYFKHVDSKDNIYDFKEFVFYKNYLAHFDLRKVNLPATIDAEYSEYPFFEDVFMRYCAGSDILTSVLKVDAASGQLDFELGPKNAIPKKICTLNDADFTMLMMLMLAGFFMEELSALQNEHNKSEVQAARIARLDTWRLHLHDVDTDLILLSN